MKDDWIVHNFCQHVVRYGKAFDGEAVTTIREAHAPQAAVKSAASPKPKPPSLPVKSTSSASASSSRPGLSRLTWLSVKSETGVKSEKGQPSSGTASGSLDDPGAKQEKPKAKDQRDDQRTGVGDAFEEFQLQEAEKYLTDESPC